MMKAQSERGFFRTLMSSRRRSDNQLDDEEGDANSDGGDGDRDRDRRGFNLSMRNIVKHHSFSGHFGFHQMTRSDSNAETLSDRQSILSKRPSLIIPFSSGTAGAPNSSNQNGSGNQNQNQNGAQRGGGLPAFGVELSGNGSAPTGQNYMEDFHAPISKSGVLVKQANHLKTWKKRLMVLKGHSLFYYVSGTSGEDTYPRGVIPLLGVKITPIEAVRFKKQNCFEICHPGYRPIYLMAKNESDLSVWMSNLTSAAMPTTPDRRMLQITDDVEKLFDTPALEDAVPYKRPYFFRQKVAFCLPRPEDHKRSMTDLFELNERRLTTLCDLNNYCDTFPMILGDPQLYLELLHMVGCYVFRPFAIPVSTAPSNIFVDDSGADEEEGTPIDKYSEYTVEEQNWSMLSSCYDLMLKAIEHIDKLEKHVRKEFFPLRFVSQLVNLFKSPSFKERQMLKGVLHRLYYKLTQRRSAIRKEIANVFYEYIYETSNHNGVAELLEILGSIVNGFACPIKQEHIVLLQRALIPLHSTPAFISYHQQLAYCMIQYVSKDHTLFTSIVRGLLKYWPVGNSFKEVVFIVEFEELLEHVLAESDFDGIETKLANRLGQSMVSSQFQIAERAISCWNSPSCVRLMNEYEKLATKMFGIIKPYLREAAIDHWNPLIQQRAQETYTVYYNMGYETDESFMPVFNATPQEAQIVDLSAEIDDDEEDILGPGSPSAKMQIRLSSEMGDLEMLPGDDDDDEKPE